MRNEDRRRSHHGRPALRPWKNSRSRTACSLVGLVACGLAIAISATSRLGRGQPHVTGAAALADTRSGVDIHGSFGGGGGDRGSLAAIAGAAAVSVAPPPPRPSRPPLVYFVHVHKAGGTFMCDLARGFTRTSGLNCNPEVGARPLRSLPPSPIEPPGRETAGLLGSA